nr:Fe-S cluster assembly protein SufD [Bacteroidota bacterium]
MKVTTKKVSLKDKMIRLFTENQALVFQHDTPEISDRRRIAFEEFKLAGFPDTRVENWRNTDLTKVLEADYNYYFQPTFSEGTDLKKIFRCDIPHLHTDMISQLNGWFVSENGSIKTNPDGVIIGSLSAASERFPELINRHLGKYADNKKSGFVALNNAFATDGVFIYVPDNVQVKVPLQMVNIINHDKDIFIQNHNLVIVGKNSELRLVQCDDSVNQQRSLINTVTEIFIDENASLDHYKLQNKNDASTLINNMFFHLERDAKLSTNAITLNGGLIRNENYVRLNGENCEANIMGVYLVDKKQHVDNQVFVDHAFPNCYSNEMFKGIVDDSARAVFNGHILVRKDAQKTNAFQRNKNILLTDKATVNSKPFLEIYADDVKCSHGATVGQLDQTAMFYLRSRGIGIENARMLLLYAFAAEIINHIKIEQLKTRIDDMIKKRLRGELSICEQCVLHCSTMEKPVEFEIDMDKI